MNRRDIKLVGTAEGGKAKDTVVDVTDIKTHPTFVDLLLVEAGMLETIT